MEILSLFNIRIEYALVFFTTVCAFLLLRTGLEILFSVENYSVYKKRQKQLQSFNQKKLDTADVLDKFTQPLINSPFWSEAKVKQLKKDLKKTGWDKEATAEQFLAMSITGKILGVLSLFILPPIIGFIMAIPFAVLFAFGPTFALSNEKKNIDTKLLTEFPEFIRIVQGYLSIDQPFVTCVERSLKFVGPIWRPLLEEFIVLCNTRDVDSALAWLKQEVDIFEVNEFISMIRLSLEQGGDAKKSFEEQAEKVHEILQDIIMLKIENRKSMSILIQAPLLLCCFVSFGLPVFGQLMSIQL